MLARDDRGAHHLLIGCIISQQGLLEEEGKKKGRGGGLPEFLSAWFRSVRADRAAPTRRTLGAMKGKKRKRGEIRSRFWFCECWR